ncbi:MAG: tetratricopeptide repeat protein [Planctomycetota bacterium]|nr:tetratricopeptide repeat protein [Planctomycetota bacterium]
MKWTAVIFLASCQIGCSINADRYNRLGKEAFDDGKMTEAINQFQTALSADPNSSDAYYNLAASYYTLGKRTNNPQALKQAEELYRQAITLNDMNEDAHRGLACLLVDTNRKQEAFNSLREWQARHPTNIDPLIELARLNQEFGNSRQAADLLTDALLLDSQNVRALTAMGYVRASQGQYAQAIQNYNRVLQLDGNQPQVAQQINELQVRMAQANQQSQTSY